MCPGDTVEERNDSAGETDEFRCAACQMSNGCQEKNKTEPRRQTAHGRYSGASNMMGDSASLQHVDIAPRAVSIEDREEMALSWEDAPHPVRVIKREMIGGHRPD